MPARCAGTCDARGGDARGGGARASGTRASLACANAGCGRPPLGPTTERHASGRPSAAEAPRPSDTRRGAPPPLRPHHRDTRRGAPPPLRPHDRATRVGAPLRRSPGGRLVASRGNPLAQRAGCRTARPPVAIDDSPREWIAPARDQSLAQRAARTGGAALPSDAARTRGEDRRERVRQPCPQRCSALAWGIGANAWRGSGPDEDRPGRGSGPDEDQARTRFRPGRGRAASTTSAGRPCSCPARTPTGPPPTSGSRCLAAR